MIGGDNNVLSDYVNIDHHSRLGSHCTFGPSVCTSGEVFIGDHAIIGSGAVIVGDSPANALVRPRINYPIIGGKK